MEIGALGALGWRREACDSAAPEMLFSASHAALVSYLDASAAQRKKLPTIAFTAMQSLMARSPVARFWRAYETALKHQPLAVQSATAGVLWGAGDVLAQKLSDRERGMSKPLDFRHSALTSLFGAAVIGPLGSAWADATVWNAFNISSFFLWSELLLESGTVSTWCTKMVKEFGTTFLAEVIAWPPIMAVIFARLPVSHHLLAVNLVTVFDVAFLATVSSGSLNLDMQLWPAAKDAQPESRLRLSAAEPGHEQPPAGAVPGTAKSERSSSCSRYPLRAGSKSSKAAKGDAACAAAKAGSCSQVPDLWGADCMHAGDGLGSNSTPLPAQLGRSSLAGKGDMLPLTAKPLGKDMAAVSFPAACFGYGAI
ncbi:hypothetical protein QJQ45_000594 [Haematococcus lacustris]|nr:hypothetical protein QJQ45_000594 [Haematococcus lacustris]